MNQYYVYLSEVAEPVEVFATKYEIEDHVITFTLDGGANGGETGRFKSGMVKGIVLKKSNVVSAHLNK